jgi:DNA polymerase-3 subunit delta
VTFEQILKELSRQKYHPVYFLHGPESYFIDAIADRIEAEALSEAEKAFNQSIFYGKEVDHLAVLDAARRYPMMAERQVVILKEAQEMRSLSELKAYVEQPMPSTILVICHKHKKYNLSSAFGKALGKHALVFEAKSLYDNQIPDWIRSYLRARDRDIAVDAAELIAEYLGGDLSKIANELDKLALNVPPGAEISKQHVDTHIGISKDFNVFELQRALGLHDAPRAFRIVNYFAANANKNPITLTLGALYGYFSKVYMLHFIQHLPEKEMAETMGLRSSYFLKEYRQAARHYPPTRTQWVIALLKEYDLKAKGVGHAGAGDIDGALLKELVWRILHEPAPAAKKNT